ncbi:MAG: alpha/beta fold hydrolase [Rhodospirillales bacterium]|nr:alpha/beta fold hydrolase [Rhodospirillales bacterium]
MAVENIEFKSDGILLQGYFYTPDEVEGPLPCVVMGGGWCYVKELIQPEYAKFFTDAGFAAITFDYRNFGDSEGEPRQHINPWEQIDDLINAITYATLRDDVDGNRIGLWGISYAGAHVFPVAALDGRVRCVMSVVPMLDGYYNTIRANSNVGYRELLDIIARDRIERFKTGKQGTIAHSAHPHEKASAFPAPETWPVFKKFKETVAPNHEHWSTIQSVEYVLRYDVTPYMKRIIHTPTLMVTSAYDDITMTEFEVPAFNKLPTPTKRLVQIGGDASHMSLYDNPDHLNLVGSACANWCRDHL